jgi:hypothetical protein
MLQYLHELRSFHSILAALSVLGGIGLVALGLHDLVQWLQTRDALAAERKRFRTWFDRNVGRSPNYSPLAFSLSTSELAHFARLNELRNWFNAQLGAEFYVSTLTDTDRELIQPFRHNVPVTTCLRTALPQGPLYKRAYIDPEDTESPAGAALTNAVASLSLPGSGYALVRSGAGVVLAPVEVANRENAHYTGLLLELTTGGYSALFCVEWRPQVRAAQPKKARKPRKKTPTEAPENTTLAQAARRLGRIRALHAAIRIPPKDTE